MLVKFAVKNWRSFRERAELNLIAGDDDLHSERVANIEKFGFKLLPTAAIYGGNASGKSNLVDAIEFAKNLIVEGTPSLRAIRTNPFRLDGESPNRPSYFDFVLLVPSISTQSETKDTGQLECCRYSFGVNSEIIVEEKLVWIAPSEGKDEDELLFERKQGEQTVYSPIIEDDRNLRSVLEATRGNQLYLRNFADQNTAMFSSAPVNKLLQVCQWFKNLVIITPDMGVSSVGLWDLLHKQTAGFNSLLSGLDTGLLGLAFEPIDSSRILSPSFLKQLEANLKEEGSATSLDFRNTGKANNTKLYAVRKADQIECNKIVSIHKSNNDQVKFDLQDDSDGTIRAIDIIPCFLEASTVNSDSVFVIDELDRSLHTLLVRALLTFYLERYTNNSRSQIIFTTHDVLQMDTDLFRRDEMWVTDRNKDGASELIPLASYEEIGRDPSVMKSYLRGQLGGIPKILLDEVDTPPVITSK